MTQWFRGRIDGFYVGLPDHAGALGAAQVGRGYRLLVYRAAIRDVELLDFTPPAPAASPDASLPATPTAAAATATTQTTTTEQVATEPTTPSGPVATPAEPAAVTSSSSEHPPEPAPLVLPPWLPAPGTAFFQAGLTDARLFPIRHNSGWFEGPIHQLFIEDFVSTHAKVHGRKLYGKFTGRAQAYFELPPAPLPVAAERIIQAFQDLPEEELPPEPARAPRQDTSTGTSADPRTLQPALVESPQAAVSPAPSPATAAAVASNATPAAPTATGDQKDDDAVRPAPPATSPRRTRVPFLILVVLVAFALLLTCGAPRAMLWLFFLLPTLLVRRIVRDIVPDTTAVRGVSALLTLGQVWLAGMVFVGWWESGCRDVHAVPLIGTLCGLFLTSVLPSDVPLLVNASSLAALLLGWCTGSSECGVAAQHWRPYGSPVVIGPAHPVQVTSMAVTITAVNQLRRDRS